MAGFDYLALVALLGASVSIALRYWETPPELLRRVVALEHDLQEHLDNVTRWMRKENVRRARDSKEESVTPPDESSNAAHGAVDLAQKKAELRARARMRRV